MPSRATPAAAHRSDRSSGAQWSFASSRFELHRRGAHREILGTNQSRHGTRSYRSTDKQSSLAAEDHSSECCKVPCLCPCSQTKDRPWQLCPLSRERSEERRVGK